jgi:hypothetical protein
MSTRFSSGQLETAMDMEHTQLQQLQDPLQLMLAYSALPKEQLEAVLQVQD